MRAIWKGTVLAESDDTVVVEGNHYFPEASLKRQYFRENTHHTRCPWKGTASYFDVMVDDEVNSNAAWFYASPSEAATTLRGRVAFWHGVDVTS